MFLQVHTSETKIKNSSVITHFKYQFYIRMMRMHVALNIVMRKKVIPFTVTSKRIEYLRT